MNEETDNNGINIWELPDHLQTCPKCYGSGEIDTAMLPYDEDYRREVGTWNDQHPKCFYCNGLGYTERELDTQWESLGITPQQAIEDWDAALKENFGEDILKQIQEIRRQQK
tara:strand:- start:169 stop:504 length:336 start_codon:yes stop_codon:yes gene_type:complete